MFSENAEIIIEDNGNGMSLDVIEKAWLTLGTDYKRKIVKESPVFHRTSLGNKGVGRLATHRLANKIMLETQAKGEDQGSRLVIDWKRLINSSDVIDDLYVNVERNVKCSFVNNQGTRITLSELREKKWTQSKISTMVRKLQNIINPFYINENDKFGINIISNVNQIQEWIDSVMSPRDILSSALYQFNFKLYRGDNEIAVIEWEYKFSPKNFSQQSSIKPHAESNKGDLLIRGNLFKEIDSSSRAQHLLKNKNLDGIENFSGEFFAFNLNKKIIDSIYGYGNSGKVKDLIENFSGVRIYRDGIRVYNYGEPSDDWLLLNQTRNKRSGDHFSKNQVVGALNLDLGKTKDTLIEKTNREGFIENECYERLRLIVQTIFEKFEKIALHDRENVRLYIQDPKQKNDRAFESSIQKIEDYIDEKGLKEDLGVLVSKVKKGYYEMQDVMLNSGLRGSNLAIVFHEVCREMGFISQDISNNRIKIEDIKIRVHSLMELIEKFTPLLKQNKHKTYKASEIIKRVIDIHQRRFKFHSIDFECPIQQGNTIDDFTITGDGGLILGAISNIIDNAIYWVDVRHEKEKMVKPSILLSIDLRSFDGPAIVVADNGTGFSMDYDDMIRPFYTLKPGGMGIGLYYVNIVMNSIGGKLLFVNGKDYDLSDKYDGACVILVFPNKNV